MSSVAIAILNYNGESHLKKFLPTLIANSSDYPVYVGDNASTDNSVKLLKNEFQNVKCIEFKENSGYSKGYNKLINKINADYIALVNSDIEATPNWLPPLVTILENNKEIAAVQPKIKSWSNKELFEYAGAAGGYVDKYGYPLCRGRLFDTLERDTGQYDNKVEISWASGACFLVRKSSFDKAGGFDDDFFAHMEEIDLCWRFHTMGLKMIYTPESTVYHVGGGTLDYSSPFKTFLNYRNGLYLLLKNLPKENLQQTIVIRVLLDWLSIIYNVLKGKLKLAQAILKAHKEVLVTRKHFLNKRKSPNDGSSAYRKDYSVVWNYFLKGKKYFNQLPD